MSPASPREPFDFDAALDRVWKDPGSTPARILFHAEKLFAAKHFEAVTIRDLAAAAGVNVSTLHFHWRDKRTLFEAVYRNHDRYFQRFFERMRREAEEGDLALEEQLDRYVDWSIDFLLQHPTAASLTAHSLCADDPLAQSPKFIRDATNLFRFVRAEIEHQLAPELKSKVDLPLSMLLLHFGGQALFADTALHRAILGGSIYESEELQTRVKGYARTLLRQMLGLQEGRES